MEFTLAEINEAIAAAVPEREAIVTTGKRLTWRDLQRRTRRLANVLLGAGLGCHREREDLQPWESGQDHLALYLYNCPEYIEGMLRAYKARVVPFNVNYRYVKDELLYLFRDAQPRAFLYHAAFAPRLAEILPRLPAPALLLQVDDGSGEPLLPGALSYERVLADAGDALPSAKPRPEDLYIAYTGGTTGLPKGVLWRQEDIFFAAMGGRLPGGGEPVESLAQVAEHAKAGASMRMLPAPPFMHVAAHWSAFLTLHQGGTLILQDNPRRLDPDDIWSTVERENVAMLTIVGDAFARPLLDALRARRYDLSSLRILGSGGAALSPSAKQALLEALPDLMIFDGFGASETGALGTRVSTKGTATPAAFRVDEHTCVLDEELRRPLKPGEGAAGWLARRGNVPLGYLGDEEKTKATYPVIDHVRYSVPGDRAKINEDGTIQFLGRDSVCINSGGEKIFVEEVEQALRRHPAVADVVVVGTPDERWGEQVTAVVALRRGATVSGEDLREAAAPDLARYKLPKAFVFVDTVLRSPTGKPDYRWAKTRAEESMAEP